DPHAAGIAALLSNLRGVPTGAGGDTRAGRRSGRLRTAGGVPMTPKRRWWPLLVLLLVGVAGEAAAQTYSSGDEQGNPHYVGPRAQVPERYRSQLPGEKPGDPPKPRLPSNRPSG